VRPLSGSAHTDVGPTEPHTGNRFGTTRSRPGPSISFGTGAESASGVDTDVFDDIAGEFR